MLITKKYDELNLTMLFDGCLDTESAPQLEAELGTIENIKELIFDFKNLEYISSSGLRQVISAYKLSVSKGFDLQIINVNNEVMNIFSMTGLADKLNIIR